MNKWEPIEKAPKDGRKILGYFGNDHAEVILWDEYWIYAYDGDAPSITHQPTHFKPWEPPE